MSAHLCSNLSYREAIYTLNRWLHRTPDNQFHLRTLADGMQKSGEEISSTLEELTRDILAQSNFDPETGLPQDDSSLPEEITGVDIPESPTRDTEGLQKIIDEINDGREEKIEATVENIQEQLEIDTDHCVYVSIDAIGVRRQKDERKENSTRETKTVQNTVAHIQYGETTYVLTASTMRLAFLEVLAYLLANDLLRYELIFIADGAKDIKSYIALFFSFHPYTVILDWYHLKKKCKETLSLAIKGAKKRNEILQTLLRYLWVGNISGAIKFLEALPKTEVKNEDSLQVLIAYIESRQDSIVCYAVRKHLKLRNSSNPVEKSNDVLIAERQKHNGMSWTPHGSSALASVEMLFKNGQFDLWQRRKCIVGFSPSEACERRCA